MNCPHDPWKSPKGDAQNGFCQACAQGMLGSQQNIVGQQNLANAAQGLANQQNAINWQGQQGQSQQNAINWQGQQGQNLGQQNIQGQLGAGMGQQSRSVIDQWILDLLDGKDDTQALTALLDSEVRTLRELKERHAQELGQVSEHVNARRQLLLEWCARLRPTITPDLLNRLLKLKSFL